METANSLLSTINKISRERRAAKIVAAMLYFFKKFYDMKNCFRYSIKFDSLELANFHNFKHF